MKIKSLKLENFGSLSEANLEFDNGFTLVSGKIGQGKSTIFEAIDYAIRKNSRPLPNMIKRGHSSLDLTLELEHNGKSFKIVDELRKKIGNIAHRKDLVIGNEKYEALGEIEEVLAQHFDPSLCGAALISRQGETELIEAKPSERKEILQRIYDLDFKDQIASLDVHKKDLEEKLKAIEDEILILKNQEYKTYDLFPEPMTKEQLDDLKKEITASAKEVLNLESKIAGQADVQKKITELTDEKNYLVVDLEKLEIKKERLLKDSSALTNSLISTTYRKSSGLESELSDAKAATVSTQTLEDLKKQLSELPTVKRLVEVKSNLEEINAKLNLLQSQYSVSFDKYSSMTQNKVCPTCSRPFEFKQEDIDKEQKLTEILKQEIDLISEERTLEKNKIAEYDAKVKENTEIKNKKALLEVQIESEEKSIQSSKLLLEQKIQNLETSLVQAIENEKNERERTLESIRLNDVQLEELKASNEQMSLKIKTVEKQIESEMSKLGNVDEIIAQINSLLDDNFEKEKLVKGYENIIQQNLVYQKHNLEVEVKKLENEKQVKVKESVRDSKVKEIDLYSSSMSILKKDFPNYVISQMISTLEEGINDFVSRVYGGRYKVYMEDTKTGIEMLYDECKAPIKEASGGEKQIFNIATKVAYSKIAGLGVLILDEVFSMLNYELAIQCFEALGSMIEDGTFNQIFVISHSEETKDYLILNYKAKVIEVDEGVAKVVA